MKSTKLVKKYVIVDLTNVKNPCDLYAAFVEAKCGVEPITKEEMFNYAMHVTELMNSNIVKSCAYLVDYIDALIDTIESVYDKGCPGRLRSDNIVSTKIFYIDDILENNKNIGNIYVENDNYCIDDVYKQYINAGYKVIKYVSNTYDIEQTCKNIIQDLPEEFL